LVSGESAAVFLGCPGSMGILLHYSPTYSFAAFLFAFLCRELPHQEVIDYSSRQLMSIRVPMRICYNIVQLFAFARSIYQMRKKIYIRNVVLLAITSQKLM
jgi:hypothetical protein